MTAHGAALVKAMRRVLDPHELAIRLFCYGAAYLRRSGTHIIIVTEATWSACCAVVALPPGMMICVLDFLVLAQGRATSKHRTEAQHHSIEAFTGAQAPPGTVASFLDVCKDMQSSAHTVLASLA